ncbi:MAG: 2Fe-2S iron-sulfur cluster-binding protein [Candidatus Thiodiazotropha endolucinida]|nr:2Fe-2S iron-sulfur cluster-binding protein [Candidatus Thiodiazotropha endolucinida]
MTTGLLALIIAVAIVLQILLSLLTGVWRKRNSLGNEDDPATEGIGAPAVSDLERHQAAAGKWEGFKPFRVVRRVEENVAGDICSFYLQPTEPMTLPDFHPGQYLTLKLELQSEGDGDKRSAVRCYSLSDRPRPDCYRISVKRVGAPADLSTAPPGQASNHLHDRVEVGDLLMVKAPSGNFHLMEEPPLPLVLIAGGIGITPMLSIINTLVEQKSEREIWLFYGVRNGREVIMHTLLKRLDQTRPHLHLHLCYSRPHAADRIGTDYQHAGHVDMRLLQDVLRLRRYQFYVCGPSAMMESIVPGLQALGIPASDIHYEAFGPASLAKPKAKVSEASHKPEASWRVTFSKSGRSAQWTNGHDSLLSFTEGEGIAVDSACRAGSCGSCQTRIESGEVEYNHAPDADVEAGHCLLCVSRPSSDLKLSL